MRHAHIRIEQVPLRLGDNPVVQKLDRRLAGHGEAGGAEAGDGDLQLGGEVGQGQAFAIAPLDQIAEAGDKGGVAAVDPSGRAGNRATPRL